MKICLDRENFHDTLSSQYTLMNIQIWLRQTTAQLEHISTTPRLDADLLLLFFLKVSKAFLYTHPEYRLSQTLQDKLQQALEQRLSGMPIAYITGEKEFWSMNFKVTPDVLIPRPETEHLVETVLAIVDTHATRRILDLGTGSGAIAIALAKERPNWTIIAVDQSLDALHIAQHNANHLLTAPHNVHFILSDWFSNVPKIPQFDAIVSNPPYIDAADPALEKLLHEPQTALISDHHGFADLQHIIAHSTAFLNSGGLLFLEHGSTQAAAVTHYLQKSGFIHIKTYQDIAGHDRMTMGEFSFH